MKKLEKMDGKLFESLKSNELKNILSIRGGEVAVTKGTTRVACGKDWITKDFTDKQNYHMDPKLGVVNDGQPYEFVVARFIMEIDVANIAADAIIYDEI